MLHFGKVRKLNTTRVLRDIANESRIEWLPECWNKTKKNPTKYGKQLKMAWNLAQNPSIVEKYEIRFLVSYFHHVVSPILHNEPWQAEYFEPVLQRAFEILYTNVFIQFARNYDYEEKYSMLKPLFEAFADAGIDVVPMRAVDCAYKISIYSIRGVKKRVNRF
jgi:hypothetical protein